jgi:hypothetical protein
LAENQPVYTNLNNGPSHVSLAETIHVQRSTAERPAPAKTVQARDGLHPFTADGYDDKGIIFIILGFYFFEALIIKMLVLWGCDVMHCSLWELMIRRIFCPRLQGSVNLDI